MNVRSAVVFISSLVYVFATVSAAEYSLGPNDDEEALVKKLQAGDAVVLTNGQWKDAELKFERLPGTKTFPMTLRAETPGEVIFTGRTEFRVSGTHIVVRGFVFRDTDSASDVVQLRTHSERHAHHCRFTDCVFEQTAKAETGTESRWLSIFGTNNRIDHCYFGGKRSRGPTVVVWVSDAIEQHTIDHNHFGPRPELGRNGGETIRIGTSDVSEQICQTTVQDNYFHACDGEAEIISNKSCENVYRHNVFDECSGALTLRHGHRCVVDANVFLGRKKSGTGGVRIIGENHVVTNNYFESLRGDAERAAICLMNGIPNSPLNQYAPVRNALVAHNTFVECKVAFEIGVGAGKKQSAAPQQCRITHNAFLPDKWELARVHSDTSGLTWAANVHQTGKSRKQLVEFERRDLKFHRAEDGLMRPVDDTHIRSTTSSNVKTDLDGDPRSDDSLIGCDDPTTIRRPLASPGSTGPTWSNKK